MKLLGSEINAEVKRAIERPTEKLLAVEDMAWLAMSEHVYHAARILEQLAPNLPSVTVPDMISYDVVGVVQPMTINLRPLAYDLGAIVRLLHYDYSGIITFINSLPLHIPDQEQFCKVMDLLTKTSRPSVVEFWALVGLKLAQNLAAKGLLLPQPEGENEKKSGGGE